jgi:predicted nucleic acid-binding protein
MTQIHTRIRVGADHWISGVAPPDVPPGEHEAMINLATVPCRRANCHRRSSTSTIYRNTTSPGTTAFPSAERTCMATTAADPVFVDTNVLVYSTRPLSAHHLAAARALARLGAAGSILWISPQILREYLAAVTRPQATAPGLPIETAINDVHRFRTTFRVAEERASALDRLIELISAHRVAGRQVHDANIVATMLDCSVYRLLTFNGADFRRFVPLIEI